MTYRRYFYAKIGKGNRAANSCLNGATPLQRPAVPIFFDKKPSSKERFLGGNSAKKQGEDFFWCGDNPDDTRIVVLHDAMLHMLRPTDKVVFWKADKPFVHADVGQFVKFLPVEIISRHRFADVPLILASMSANTYYYTGTFREITDQGNIRALQHIADEDSDPIRAPVDLIRCLSSMEIETLVAKMFEEAGCFVPAYRGGTLKDVDIIARNVSSHPISVMGHEIPRHGSVAIQVKRTNAPPEAPTGCDVLVAGDRDAPRILDQLQRAPKARHWLAQSLGWLPSETLARFGLR